MKTRVVLALAPSVVGLFLLNCSDPALCEGPQCAVATDGGGDGAGDATLGDGGGKTDGAPVGDGGPGKDGGADGSDGTSPTSCNTSADVSSQPACVADAYAVFVNGMTGSDLTGDGTKENAFKSIGKGVASASSTGRVFICATTYPEPVKLTSNVSLYGGFDCSGWAYSTNNVPKVAPSTAEYALELQTVSAATIEGIEFDALAGPDAGSSSVAVFAATSTNVTLRNDVITAAAAGPAPAAPTAVPNYTTGTKANQGTTATSSSGVGTQTCRCIDTTESMGGRSGSGDTDSPAAGGNGGPVIAGKSGGDGGTYSGTACGNGILGATANDGSGSAGASSRGTLVASGWTPSGGAAGTSGQVAQGGGGGSGGKIMPGDTDGAGGGGGCGGCGGGAGPAGSGGGSSFAVLSFNSTLTFDNCKLTAASGSNGGSGGDGQLGQGGGFGGVQSIPGCQGGGGGNGGNGGGGGGGAAGVSVDVGYVGMAPTVMTNCTTSISSQLTMGGAGGAFGSPAAGMGRAGANVPVLDLSN